MPALAGWTAYLVAVALGLYLGKRCRDDAAFERRTGVLFAMLLTLASLMWAAALGIWSSVVDGNPYLGIPLMAALGLGIGAAWMQYLSCAVSTALTDGLRDALTGDDRLKAAVSFDRGDAAMKRGDPALALKEYAAELERHPDEPELFLRMADAHQALGDGAQRLSCLREAVRVAKDPHRRGPLLLLASEALGKAGDEAGRREALKAVLADPALAAYHAAARARKP